MRPRVCQFTMFIFAQLRRHAQVMFPSLKFRVWCQIIISIVSFYFFFFFFLCSEKLLHAVVTCFVQYSHLDIEYKTEADIFSTFPLSCGFFICLFILATICCFFCQHLIFSKKICFIIILRPMYIVNSIIFTSTKEIMFFTCVCSWLDCHQNYTKTVKWITTKLGWRIILGPEQAPIIFQCGTG